MSKLTPLSSALVLALPLLLTACGGNNGATGNNHSGSNAAPKAKNSGEQVNKQEQKFPSHVNVNQGTEGSAKNSSTGSNTASNNVNFVRGGQEFVSTNGTSNEKEISANDADKLLNKVTPVSPVAPETPVNHTSDNSSTSGHNTYSSISRPPVVPANPTATTQPANTAGSNNANSDVELSADYSSSNISTPTIDSSEDNLIHPSSSGEVKPTVAAENVFTVSNSKYQTFKNSVSIYDGETKGLSAEDDPNLSRDIYRLTNRSVQNELIYNKSLNKDLNQDLFLNSNRNNIIANKSGALFVNLNPILDGVAAPEAFANAPTKQYLTGRGVTAVIIDGNVDPGSNYFDNIPTRLNYYGDPVHGDEDVVDSNNNSKANHGTFVGSIIAGARNYTNTGFAPDANLKYILLPKNPSFSDIYEAAIRSGATVVNNSYSFSGYSNLVLDYASAKQLLERETTNNENMPVFVFATGNQYVYNGRIIDYQFNPSSILVDFTRNSNLQDSIITTTGVKVVPDSDKRGTIVLKKEFFKPDNYAIPCGDTYFSCLAAPNSYLWSDGNSRHVEYGTSFAAPQVSGAIALVKEQFPWMNAGNLKTTVLTTAIDIGIEGVDRETGWGLLNVARAVKGPMQFAFGDFYANLKDSTGNYYFSNNIFGRGGLIIDADRNNTTGKLILTGNNVFKGDTIVHRGTLVVTNSLKSKLVIRSNGKAIVNSSTIGNTYNNGIMVAKDTVVNGDYKQGSYATLVVEPEHPIEIRGEATLAGTLKVDNADNYVSSRRSLKTVLNAQKIKAGTHFYNKVYTNDSQVNYDIYYDYTDGLVQVDIYRKNSNETAAVLASVSLNSDRDAISNGGKLLENYFSNIDFIGETNTVASSRNSYGGNRDGSSPSNGYYEYYKFKRNKQSVTLDSISSEDLLSAASEIQAMSTEEMNNLIIKASGSSYANNFKAISLAGIDKSDRFSDAVIDRALDKDNTDNYQAYFDAEYQGKDGSWKTKESKVAGEYTDTSSNAGLIYSSNKLNLGISVNAGSAKWSQKLNKEDDKVYADINDKLVGTNLDLTFAKETSSNTQVFIGGSLGYTHHSLKASRNLFQAKDNTTVDTNSEFTANEVRSSIQAGVRYSPLSNLDLGFKARLNYSSLNADSFAEKANKTVYSDLALNFNKGIQSGYLYSTLGFNAQYSFNNIASLLLSTEWRHLLSGGDNKIDTTLDNVKVTSNLENNDIFSIDATFRTNITKSMSFDIGAKYNFSSMNKDYAVKASLSYSF